MAVNTYTYTLNTGLTMPAVGLGTYRVRSHNVIMQIVDDALKAGYRMFDTASVYGNEKSLGVAFQTLLPKYGLKREDIFITTKLAPSHHGGGDVTKDALMTSLTNLGLDYVDLYLIHFPGASGMPTGDVRNRALRGQTWRTMAEMHRAGRAKSIGVSNYTVRHLTELMGSDGGVCPAVNQVEWHPYFWQPELLQYCKERGIVLQAYCSLGGTSASDTSLMEDPVVTGIADKHCASSAQVLLAWALQHGVAVIPKSTNAGRIRDNITIACKLSDQDMASLDELRRRNVKYAWNPDPVA